MRLLARFFVLLLPIFQLFAWNSALHAQAEPTASTGAALTAFGAFSVVNTGDPLLSQYPDHHTNPGATLGFGYTRFLRCCLDPTLEARVKFAPGISVSEHTYGGGFRFEHRFGVFHPYADFLMSYGIIHFNHPNLSLPGPPYTHDTTAVPSIGAGCDFDLNPKWAARVDFQREHWNLSNPNRFNPLVFSFGVVYRITFSPH